GEVADSTPDSVEMLELGLRARIFALNIGWRVGISREEAEAMFAEAQRMASKAGDIRSRATLLGVYGVARGTGDGDVREYAALARQATALAEESGDAALQMATASGAYALFAIGEYREGVAMLDRA